MNVRYQVVWEFYLAQPLHLTTVFLAPCTVIEPPKSTLTCELLGPMNQRKYKNFNMWMECFPIEHMFISCNE